MTLDPMPSRIGLRRECLSFPEVLAQSIADVAPAGMVALTIPLVFGSAGKGTWLAYLIATVGLTLVSLNINQFARRSASPGALYIYITKGLGPLVGVISGWGLLFAYLGTAMTILAGFAISTDTILKSFNFQISPILLFAVCAGIAWFYAYTDIQLSAVLMLIFEISSMCLLLVLVVFVLFKHGNVVDISQVFLQDVTPSGLQQGLVLAVFSYVGFESATALGDEAKKPLRYIPQAIIMSTVLAGSFFVLLSYVEVLGFEGYQTSLDKTKLPLAILAQTAGVGWLGVLLSVGIAFSFLSCCLAALNAGARILSSMASHGIFPLVFSQAHLENKTPHMAVSVSALFIFLVPTVMSAFGIQVLDIYGYLGTIATFGFLFAYILISIAAPVYLHGLGRLRPANIVIAVLASVFMLIPIVGSVYPVPAAPYNIFPYLFLLLLGAGSGWFIFLSSRSPQIVLNIQNDIKNIQRRFGKY